MRSDHDGPVASVVVQETEHSRSDNSILAAAQRMSSFGSGSLDTVDGNEIQAQVTNFH